MAVNTGFIQYLSYKGCRGFYLSTKFKDAVSFASYIIEKKQKKDKRSKQYKDAQNALSANFKSIKVIEFQN